jgi:hypothetical protein
LRFNERILRYQTVKIDKKLDIETLREKETQGTLEASASGETIATVEPSEGAQEDTVA